MPVVRVLDVSRDHLDLERLVPARPTTVGARDLGRGLALLHDAGAAAFAALQDEEPGTFYLTDFLARQFELAGGAIRNAAINAAYAAAADRATITLTHLVRASVSELVKAGRAPTRADLGELAALGQF